VDFGSIPKGCRSTSQTIKSLRLTCENLQVNFGSPPKSFFFPAVRLKGTLEALSQFSGMEVDLMEIGVISFFSRGGGGGGWRVVGLFDAGGYKRIISRF